MRRPVGQGTLMGPTELPSSTWRRRKFGMHGVSFSMWGSLVASWVRTKGAHQTPIRTLLWSNGPGA